MADDFYFSELQERHLYDGLEEDVCSGEELLIDGPAGPIEVLTSCPECYEDSRPIAIICHPHPLYGGSMKNKVVHILSETFNGMGLLSITFNFQTNSASFRSKFDGVTQKTLQDSYQTTSIGMNYCNGIIKHEGNFEIFLLCQWIDQL